MGWMCVDVGVGLVFEEDGGSQIKSMHLGVCVTRIGGYFSVGRIKARLEQRIKCEREMMHLASPIGRPFLDLHKSHRHVSRVKGPAVMPHIALNGGDQAFVRLETFVENTCKYRIVHRKQLFRVRPIRVHHRCGHCSLPP